MKPDLRLIIPIILIGGLLLVGGCGGGGAKVESSTTATTTTMGQELMDINKAHQEGIITDKEYEKAKKQIMKRYDK